MSQINRRSRMYSLPETPCKPFAGLSLPAPLPKQRSSAPALLESSRPSQLLPQELHRRRRKRSSLPAIDPNARPFVKTTSSGSIVNLGQIAADVKEPILIDLSMSSVASDAGDVVAPPPPTSSTPLNYLLEMHYPEKTLAVTTTTPADAIPEAEEPTPAAAPSSLPSTPSRTPRKLSGLSPAMRGIKSIKLAVESCSCCGKKMDDKELTTISPCKVKPTGAFDVTSADSRRQHLLCFHCVSAVLNVICTTNGPMAKARCAACGDVVQAVIPNVLNAPEVRKVSGKTSTTTTTTVPAIVRLDNVPTNIKLEEVIAFVGEESLHAATANPVHVLFDVKRKNMRNYLVSGRSVGWLLG